MPRKNLIRTNVYPYHVTTRTHNKEWFDIPISIVWKICIKCLNKAQYKYPVDIISFVLMQNHYHLLISTPNCDLDKFMYEFNKNLSLYIRKRSQKINQVFGSRYKWCLINNNRYLANCYRYIYQNPIRAGVSKTCQDYPYSTLHSLAKNKISKISIKDIYGFKDSYGVSWLNESIDDKEIRAIRSSFKKTTLDTLKDPVTREKIY